MNGGETSSKDSVKVIERGKTYTCGCWSIETRSSTHVDEAMEARPGRVTVHI
jgi:hypothetical protein